MSLLDRRHISKAKPSRNAARRWKRRRDTAGELTPLPFWWPLRKGGIRFGSGGFHVRR